MLAAGGPAVMLARARREARGNVRLPERQAQVHGVLRGGAPEGHGGRLLREEDSPLQDPPGAVGGVGPQVLVLPYLRFGAAGDRVPGGPEGLRPRGLRGHSTTALTLPFRGS